MISVSERLSVTHQVLAGAALPRGELEVVPSQQQQQEEGQHEELPVPHRHQEDLRRRRTGHVRRGSARLSNLGGAGRRNKICNGFNRRLKSHEEKASADSKAAEISQPAAIDFTLSGVF